MELTKEQIEVMIQTFEELIDIDNSSLFTEQWDLYNYLKDNK
jgi:hypothetical protein